MKGFVFGLLFCFVSSVSFAQEVAPDDAPNDVANYDAAGARIKQLEDKIAKLEALIGTVPVEGKVLSVNKYGLLNSERLTIRGDIAEIIIQPNAGGVWIAPRVDGKTIAEKAICLQLNNGVPFLSLAGKNNFKQPGADLVAGLTEEGVAYFQIRQPDGNIVRFPQYQEAPVQGAAPVDPGEEIVE